MEDLLFFIPAAVCLLVTLIGLVGVIGTALILRRGAPSSVPAPHGLPPTSAPSRRRIWWKCGLWLSGAMLMAGLLGLWATGFSIGWAGNAPKEWSDGRAPELESLIRKRCVPFMQQGKSIGMTVAVVTPAHATAMSFGRPSLTPWTRMRDDTVFEIGSITKTFTAIALARAIERGTMRLEQPMQELLPPNVELPLAARAVTLRHLTTHTSGFPRSASDPRSLAAGFSKMLLFGSDPCAGFSEADLLNSLRGVKLGFKPGTKSEYSNFGMNSLGYLLAKNAGVNYETLIEREVCRPLGMEQTTVTLDGMQADRFAQGYRAVLRYGPVILALRSSPWDNAPLLGGDGALRSTGTDMLKYLQANMHPAGSSIEHALRESHRELFRENERRGSGMNWQRSRWKGFRNAVIWHNGGTGGFVSFLGFTEDGSTGVLILSNTAQPVDALALDLLRDLVPSASSENRL